MKLTPVASPHAIQTPHTTNNTATRAAAIAAFERASAPPQQAQEHPVQNPTKVSPEELSAVSPHTQEVADTQPQTENPDNSTASEDTPPPKPPQKDPALSSRFAQLARQERQQRVLTQQRDADFKAREAALAAREAELSAKVQEYTPDRYISKDRVKQDALAVLADAGVSYDELTQQILNQQPTDPRLLKTIQDLQVEIKALKTANEETRKSYDNQQEESRKAAIKQIEVDVKGLIRNDPTYETIKATNSVRDVVDLITQTYDKDGVLMTVEEAAQEVENYLIEEALKITRIGKIQQRLKQTAQSAQAGAKTPAKPAATPAKPGMKTLTNANSGSRKLSSRERAIAAFHGEKV